MDRIALTLPFLFAGTLVAQTQWVNFPATAPGTLAGHDFVATSGAAVMFGGENPKNTYHNDTWTWDTASLSWTLQTPANAPSIRAAHEMAYDPIRNKVVLFGGWNGGLWYNQTWEWDGTNWAQMAPNHIPTARDWLAMEFDPISQRIILFGGHTTSGWPNVPNAFGDTWAWDGTDWTQLSPATVPAIRFGHEMALDTRRGRIVMYGGFGRLDGNDPGTAYQETWSGPGPTGS